MTPTGVPFLRNSRTLFARAPALQTLLTAGLPYGKQQLRPTTAHIFTDRALPAAVPDYTPTWLKAEGAWFCLRWGWVPGGSGVCCMRRPCSSAPATATPATPTTTPAAHYVRRRGRRRRGRGGRGGRGGGGNPNWFLHDDREDFVAGEVEDADPAYYAADSAAITVRISATRKGAREVSDTTGALPCCVGGGG